MKVRLFNRGGGERWVSVDCEVVDVAPHLVAAFVLHESPFGKKVWTITHADTGCKIAEDPDREDALTLARIKLKKIDQTKLDTAIAKARAQIQDYEAADGEQSTAGTK